MNCTTTSDDSAVSLVFGNRATTPRKSGSRMERSSVVGQGINELDIIVQNWRRSGGFFVQEAIWKASAAQ